MVDEELRPPFGAEMSSGEFDRWYWPKETLVAACRTLGLPVAGSKAELRARVLDKLAGRSPEPIPPRTATAGWPKTLSSATRIPDAPTFGPAFRGYMTGLLGARFRCTARFMAWVRDHPGETLADAAAAWEALDREPGRRPIARHNNYLQYLRDFSDDNPSLGRDIAKRCWDAKKVRPAEGGYVRYARADLDLLG